MTGAEYLRSLPDGVAQHVRFYVNNGMVDRILAVHVADESGHCAGCVRQEHPRPTWPCSLAYHAGVARDLEILAAQDRRDAMGRTREPRKPWPNR